MKLYILTQLLFVVLLNMPRLTGQPVYFNRTIDLVVNWGSGKTAISSDSAYYINAVTGPGVKITMIKLSLLGNEVGWIKKYGNENETWYPGSPGSLCQVSMDGYILGGSIGSSDTIFGLLMRFDNSFDTLFTKRYINNTNYALILTCAKSTYDNGLIFSGEIYIGGINTDLILLKTNDQGSEIWRTIKNIGYADRGWSIIQTPDSGYVIGGYTYYPGSYHSGNPLIIKFDKNGTYQWQRNPGGPYEDDKAMVCMNSDSTFTVLTAIADSIYNNDFGYAKICLIKYTQDGTELWKKKYGESIGGNFTSNIKPLSDGGFICCGGQREPGNYDVYRFGWLLRLDKDGDSIWFRRYAFIDGHQYEYNFLYDVSVASDGGFIATGQTQDDDPPTLQKVWVLKVDSIGCDTAGCDPTVGIEEGGEAWRQGSGEAGKQGELVVWPNPARDEIHVRFYMDDGRFYSDLGLEIYDIFGREASEVLHSSPRVGGGREGGWQGWTVDVSAFPPGIYFAVIREGNIFEASGKFVIAR